MYLLDLFNFGGGPVLGGLLLGSDSAQCRINPDPVTHEGNTMYLTYQAIDWTWLDNRAATCLTASILERKDCIRDRQKDLERLIKRTESWKRRTKYRDELEQLNGGMHELDNLHGHLVQVHHDNTCDDITESEIAGTRANGETFNYGGTNGK